MTQDGFSHVQNGIIQLLNVFFDLRFHVLSDFLSLISEILNMVFGFFFGFLEFCFGFLDVFFDILSHDFVLVFPLGKCVEKAVYVPANVGMNDDGDGYR